MLAHNRQKSGSYGFTIVELLVVIVVIGILAAVTIVAYTGVAKRAIDSSVSNDAQQTQTGLGAYAVDHSDTYTAWSSNSTPPSGLRVPIGTHNSIDVSVSSDQKSYCIRVYNEKSTYSSLANAYTIGSTTSACQSVAPTLASTGNQWSSVYAGDYSTCALAVTGFVYCWGANFSGNLGSNNSDLTQSLTPLPLYTGGDLAGKTIKQLTYKSGHGCVITTENKPYCWGDNLSGGLGNGSTSDSYVPTAVVSTGVISGKAIAAVDPGLSFMCSTDTDGKMYCWGEDDNKQLGNNSLTNSPVPVIASAWGTLDNKTITSFSSGNDHVCMIASGTAYCYGDNGSGQSAIPVSSYATSATNISGLSAFSGKTITQIVALGDHTCALTSNNQLYCWGYGTQGGLGDGTNTAAATAPSAVVMSGALAGKTIASITGGYYTTCALSTDGNAYCWGLNSYGQLGNNSTTSTNTPVAVSAGAIPSNVKLQSLSASNYHACGIGSDKKIYCWGFNIYGELGTGSSSPYSFSVPVQALPNL